MTSKRAHALALSKQGRQLEKKARALIQSVRRGMTAEAL